MSIVRRAVFSIAFLLIGFFLFAQNVAQVSGIVKDENANGISDVLVHVLNTNISVFTNVQGEFVIKNIPSGKYKVSFTAVGYAVVNKDVDVASAGNSLDVQLATTAKQLDDVVVTAEKKEESLQKLPVSITALSSKQVNDFRFVNNSLIQYSPPPLSTSDFYNHQ